MSEGQKQRDGGFSGGLAAARWFGGFVFEIDVLLGNGSSCPNSRSESCPGTSSFVSDTGVSAPTSSLWFQQIGFCLDTCVNTVIREGRKKNSRWCVCSLCLSENCFQSEFTFVFWKKMHRKCLRPAIEAQQQQFVRCYQITMCKFPACCSDTDAALVPDGEMYENVNGPTHG